MRIKNNKVIDLVNDGDVASSQKSPNLPPNVKGFTDLLVGHG